MLRYLSVAQVREADRRCIEGIGIPGAVLMNNAGASVFREVDRGPVGIVCGRGSNGGDGFVVARLALLAGFAPRVVLLADPSEVEGDAAIFLKAYRRLGGLIECVADPGAVEESFARFAGYAVVVDAMLGTGLSGEVRGIYRTAIEAWPKLPTVAVDLPSGLNADTGQPRGACLRADVTVTFQFPKRGFENADAQPYLGRLVVADIGIPPVCADDEAWQRIEAAGA